MTAAQLKFHGTNLLQLGLLATEHGYSSTSDDQQQCESTNYQRSVGTGVCQLVLLGIVLVGIVLLSGNSLLELVKVARTHRQVESEVLFLGRIRLHQLKVGLSESLLSLSDRGIGLGKLGILCLDGPGLGLSGVVEIESDHSHKKQEESNHNCNEQVMSPFLGLLLLGIYICLLDQRHC